MRRWFLGAAVAVLTLAVVGQAELARCQSKEKRVYLIGNSLTDNVNYGGLQKLAESRDYKEIWGRSMTPGAPIVWHWDHEPSFTQQPFGPYRKALTEYEWDAVTFQPFVSYDREFPAILKFMELMRPKNAQAQVYVYAQWPSKNGGDWDQQFTRQAKNPAAMTSSQGIPAYYDRFVRELRQACPGMKPALLIPTGHAMYLLDQKIKAGQVPGIASIWDLYADGVHLRNIGSYIAGISFFSVIFGESPVGLPTDAYQDGGSHKPVPLTPELAKVLQETVWETVTSLPLTGVTTNEPVKVVLPILSDAVQGKPYEAALLAGLGKPPYRWSLAKGTLPQGLALTADGVVSGTATVLGRSVLTFQVADANDAKSARDLTLNVVADDKPVIEENELPKAQVGLRYTHVLRASGGNGALTWHLAQGQTLPAGLSLDVDGSLAGTPVKEGTYTFKVQTEDADRGTPDVTGKDVSMTVGPAGPEVLFVREVPDKSLNFDGAADEPFWKFDHKIEKLVDGEKTGIEAAFDVVLQGDALCLAVRVRDSSIQEGGEDLDSGDSVEVFIDALNNREEQYNFDDRRVTVAPSGKSRIVGNRSLLGCRAKRTADGYDVEVQVYGYNLGVPMRDNALGLDVAVNDAGEKGARACQLVWRGTKDDATVPNRFATIVLPPKADAAKK